MYWIRCPDNSLCVQLFKSRYLDVGKGAGILPQLSRCWSMFPDINTDVWVSVY